MILRLTGALVAALTLAACPAPNEADGLPASPPTAALDWAQFVCGAQPILVKRCSYLGCHGDANHALRIYSPGKLRLSATTRSQRDEPLSPAEVNANYHSAAGQVWPVTGHGGAVEPTDIPLLRKPLDAAFGGSEHHGVVVFPVPPHATLGDDPEWRALSDWALGKKAARPLTTDCAALFDALMLDPNGGPT